MIWVRSGMTWEPKAVLEFNLALGWDWARGTLFSDSRCLLSSLLRCGCDQGKRKRFPLLLSLFAQELCHLTFRMMQLHTVGKRKLLLGPNPLGPALSNTSSPNSALGSRNLLFSPFLLWCLPNLGPALTSIPCLLFRRHMTSSVCIKATGDGPLVVFLEAQACILNPKPCPQLPAHLMEVVWVSHT